MRTRPGTQHYRLTTTFTYTLDSIPGDPTDLDELSELELNDVYSILREMFPTLNVSTAEVVVEALPDGV